MYNISYSFNAITKSVAVNVLDFKSYLGILSVILQADAQFIIVVFFLNCSLHF